MSLNPSPLTSIPPPSSVEPIGIIDPTPSQTIGPTPSTTQDNNNQQHNTYTIDTINTGMREIDHVHHTTFMESSVPSSVPSSLSVPSTPNESSQLSISNFNLPNSTKSLELQLSIENTPLSQSLTIASSPCSSSGSTRIESTSLHKLMTTSSYSTSALQSQHSDNFITNLIPSTHLVESEKNTTDITGSVVAPGPVLTISSNPNIESNLPLGSAEKDHQHTTTVMNTSTCASEIHESNPSSSIIVSSSSSITASKGNSFKINFEAAMQTAFNKSTLSSIKSSSSLSSSSSTSSDAPLIIDTKCHCLVVNPSFLQPSPHPDFEQYQIALSKGATSVASDKQRTALKQHCIEWLGEHLTIDDISTVYVERHGGTTLHINFVNHFGLSRALASFPFLVRCGSSKHQSKWTPPCGPVRSNLPELIRITCIPSAAELKSAQYLDSSTENLLKEMKLEVTAFWSKMTPEKNMNKKSNELSHMVTISVLPRHIQHSDLSSMMERLHMKYKFWGGPIRVTIPNIPQLSRCTQCDTLGHETNKCTLYQGLAIRLLMKEPVSFQAMTQLVSLAKCRIGYLGSGIGESKPSRRVTLLFDITLSSSSSLISSSTIASDSSIELQTIFTNMEQILLNYRELFHSPPSIVETRNRYRECKECGSMENEHQCTFNTNNYKFGQYHNNQSTSSSASASASASSSSSSSTSLGASSSNQRSDDMCRSWRFHKKCSRKITCPYKHPEDHIVTSVWEMKLCHSFRDHGHCPRGTTCKFAHELQNTTVVQSTSQSISSEPSSDTNNQSAANLVPTNIIVTEATTSSTAATSSSSSSKPKTKPTFKRRATELVQTVVADSHSESKSDDDENISQQPSSTSPMILDQDDNDQEEVEASV